MHPLLQILRNKYEWGTKHLNALNKEVAAWIDSDPYTVVSEVNEDATKCAYFIKFRSYPNLVRWGLMAGDTLYNFRCVLDHLVCALAAKETGQTPPPNIEDLAFPITDTDAKFDSVAGRKLSGLSDSAIALIKRAQPHAGRNQALAVLHKLNNIDKHRVSIVSAPHIKDPEVRLLHSSPVHPKFGVWVNNQPLKHEAKIMEITFFETCREMDVDLRFAVSVSFWEEVERGRSIMETLCDIQDEVARIMEEDWENA